MSWRNKIACVAIMATVLGIFCIGQVYARPDLSMDGPSANAIANIYSDNGFWGQLHKEHQAPMRPIPTMRPMPGHNTSAEVLQGYTDKNTYTAGDTAHGYVVLKNTGDTVINDVTLNVFGYKSTALGYVFLGSKSGTLSGLEIQPGTDKKLDQQVKVPGKYMGFLTSGDYKLEVKLSTDGTYIGSFTTYFTVK